MTAVAGPAGEQVSTSFTRRPSDADITEVTAAARAAGQIGPEDTAVVFHDLDLLDQRLVELTRTFPVQTLHAIAIKSNPSVEILRRVVAAGHGLEAASIEEVHLAIAAGCPAERIVFDSPAKTHAEIAAALDLGIRINADSFDELDRIAAVIMPAHRSVLGLRINPMVGAGSIPITGVAGKATKFGVSIDRALEPLVERARVLPHLRCLHIHIGSQGVKLEAHEQAAAAISRFRKQLHAALGEQRFDVVDIGGGMSTSYVDDSAMHPGQIVAGLRRFAPDLLADQVQLVTEYGRAVQVNCGWALSRIEYFKDVGGQAMAVGHLGSDMLLRAVYHPDFWKHRISRLGGRRSEAPADAFVLGDGTVPQSWSISGPLCFQGDVIARGVDCGPLTLDDQLVVHDVGGYTMSLWNRHCSRGMPKIVGYQRAGDSYTFTVLRRRETPADVVRFWSADLGG